MAIYYSPEVFFCLSCIYYPKALLVITRMLYSFPFFIRVDPFWSRKWRASLVRFAVFFCSSILLDSEWRARKILYSIHAVGQAIASCFIYSKYRIFSLPSHKRQQNIYHDKCKRYTNEPYMNSSTLEQIHINKGQPNAHRRLSPTHKSYHRKRSLITNHSQPCAFGHSIRYAEAKTIYGLVNSGSDYYFFFL